MALAGRGVNVKAGINLSSFRFKEEQVHEGGQADGSLDGKPPEGLAKERWGG